MLLRFLCIFFNPVMSQLAQYYLSQRSEARASGFPTLTILQLLSPVGLSWHEAVKAEENILLPEYPIASQRREPLLQNLSSHKLTGILIKSGIAGIKTNPSSWAAGIFGRAGTKDVGTNTLPLQIHLIHPNEKGNLMAPVSCFADSFRGREKKPLSTCFTFFDAQYTIPPSLHQLLTAPDTPQPYI